MSVYSHLFAASWFVAGIAVAALVDGLVGILFSALKRRTIRRTYTAPYRRQPGLRLKSHDRKTVSSFPAASGTEKTAAC